jgi:hypothetical protein
MKLSPEKRLELKVQLVAGLLASGHYTGQREDPDDETVGVVLCYVDTVDAAEEILELLEDREQRHQDNAENA